MFNIIKELSLTSHHLFLISFIAEQEESVHVDALKGYCEDVIIEHLPPFKSFFGAGLGLFSRTPLQVAYYKSKKMKKTISFFLEKMSIELIYVHLFRMASYVEGNSIQYSLIDLTDVISSEVEQSIDYRSGIDKWLYSMELPRIKEYERKISTRFNECWVISQREADILRALSPSCTIRVIPNGVDLAAFHPHNKDKREKIVIFSGHLRVPHNIDAVLYFYHDIFKFIIERHTDVKFYIVGSDPHPKIKNLCKDQRVIVTGFVQNLNDYLNRASVFVAPLRFSTGIQNKILEAMSAGVPVVCSPSANEGLRAQVGQEIIVASTPSEFANSVNDVLSHPERAQNLSKRARLFVERNFSWKKAVKRIEAIENIVKSGYAHR